MSETEKIKVAIVGAGREGLETLNIIRKDIDLSVLMILDADREALGFRLEKYGYGYADDLNLRLSHRLRELKTIQDLNLIIDTVPGRYHRDLYDLDIYPSEIINGNSANLIWELKFIDDMEKRRTLLTERINNVIESTSNGLQSLLPSIRLNEFGSLILRSAFLTSHADSSQLTIIEKDEPSKVIKDISISSDLLIKKVSSCQHVEEREETDSIIRYVLENRSVWEGGMGKIKGWDAISAIPVMAGYDAVGILWLYYTSSKINFLKDDIKYLSAVLPYFGNHVKEAIDSERTRLTVGEETLEIESLNILGSERPIGTKLKDFNTYISRLLCSEDSRIYIKDPATGDLVLQAATSRFPSISERTRIRKGQGILNEVLARGTPVVLREESLCNEKHQGNVIWREDTISFLYLPFIFKNKGVGIMAMEFTNTHNFTPGIFNSLVNVGNHLANTISSDVERYRMSQKIIKLSAVNEEGIELLSTVDPQKILALTTSTSAMLLDSEVSILRLFEENRLIVKSTHGIQEEKIDQALLDMDNNISGMVSQMKVPILVHDTINYMEEIPSDDFPYKTAMVIPIIYNKELFGSLSIYNKKASEGFSSSFFTEDDREILEHFSHYVARGVMNARHYNDRQSLITIDETTGLRNERYLQIRFPEEINRAKRFNRSVSLIFFEIRPYDESIIKEISRLIKDTFRYIDVLVRLKDAKFAALLPDTGEGVRDAVKRLSFAFNQFKIKRPHLALYAGYSTYPDDSDDMHELIKKSSRLQQY